MNFLSPRQLAPLICLLLLCFTATGLRAQCPPSATDGVHVVQKGETFFRIAQMYNVSTDQLATWNNTTSNSRIIECDELVVSA
ncbi:MAG: LysM domain-containing protein, partial [Bacteroidota bacterium]